MSATAKSLIEAHVQVVPPVHARAAGDLRHLVKERHAQIGVLENQIPALKREGSDENLKQIADLVAVHREAIFQLEAGIAAGQARFDAASKAPDKFSATLASLPASRQGR